MSVFTPVVWGTSECVYTSCVGYQSCAFAPVIWDTSQLLEGLVGSVC